MSAGLDEPIPLPLSANDARQADRAAFEALFALCETRIGRYLAQMVDDRVLAEDLLQDTFHDAFRARAQLAAVRDPEAWLFGIARNRALNALRRGRRFRRALGRLRSTAHATETLETVAVRDLLERSLKPEDRSLILLRYLHGFTADELAAMTRLSPAAVRQRLSRARSRLAAAAADSAPTHPDKE